MSASLETLSVRDRDRGSLAAPPTGSSGAVTRPRFPQNVACGFPAPRTAIGKKYLVERTISVHEDLLAMAANVFKLRHKPLEIAGWKGEQKPIARPIW